MSEQTRFICKRCGAESPTGIGYVLAPGEKPQRAEPDPTCPNQHANTWLVVGVWDVRQRAHALVAMPGDATVSWSSRVSVPAYWTRSVVAGLAHQALDMAEEQVRSEYREGRSNA